MLATAGSDFLEGWKDWDVHPLPAITRPLFSFRVKTDSLYKHLSRYLSSKESVKG